ncbi:MAG: DUF1772 domain-containing protein [Acidimicrobiia bacterium]|nr:DUF1772 domain-containing protein [Acidimicrobiia bacterium]
MGFFQIALTVAAFLCSLVAGFLFAFAIVVMPGIKKLSDREFIRAFQTIDRVIQNNQPVFLLVWVGSVLALIAAAFLGMGQLDRVGRVLIISAAVAYLVGVQLPTVAISIPLNNKLHTVNVDALNDSTRHAARKDFEPRWNHWNTIRTAMASLVSALLLVLLFRL